MPAVVIPWRDEGDGGECLRYTLRGVDAHLPHREVVVAGDPLPGWVTGLHSVVLPRQSNRYEDGQANVLAALGEVDGWAYIMHDDMLINRPVDWIAPSNRGLLSAYRGGGSYYAGARLVAGWLKKNGYGIVNFNVHLPFLVDADRYLEVAELVSDLRAGFRASVYGNILGLKTRRVFDPKVVQVGAQPNGQWPVWSTSDRSFERGLVGKRIRGLFPNPGRYENV